MLNILHVEDDDTIARCTKTYLEDICGDYQVTSIDRGNTAFELLSKAHSFDCIVLDMTLPGKSGLEVLQALRALDQVTPAIICSAVDFDERKQACRKAGADEFIAKPFEVTELHRLITSLVWDTTAV